MTSIPIHISLLMIVKRFVLYLIIIMKSDIGAIRVSSWNSGISYMYRHVLLMSSIKWWNKNLVTLIYEIPYKVYKTTGKYWIATESYRITTLGILWHKHCNDNKNAGSQIGADVEEVIILIVVIDNDIQHEIHWDEAMKFIALSVPSYYYIFSSSAHIDYHLGDN